MFILTGCGENFLVNTGVVDGRIFGFRGGAIPCAEIHTGKPPLTYSDSSGRFHFESLSKPYTINTKSYIRSTNSGEIFITDECFFDKLTCNYPQIVVPADWYHSLPRTRDIIINVKFPEIEPDKNGCIFFISKDKIFTSNCFFLHPGESSSRIKISIHFEQSSFSGQICFMQFIGNYYSIFSYENFGLKEIELHNDHEVIEFTPDDIKFNPNEKFMKIDSYSQYSIYSNEVYLSFDGCPLSSDANIISFAAESGVYLPANLPLKYKFKVISRASSWFGSSTKTVYTGLDAQCKIFHSTGIDIRTPVFDEINVNENTRFTFFSPEDEKSIYIVNIRFYKSGIEYSYYYHTRSNNISFKDIISSGFKPEKNTRYEWWVERYSDFNSLDEFVKMPLFDNRQYMEKIESSQRYFTTAP